ncbi:MAG: DUF4446 family protein [Promethearchaeota archaeon]
MFKFFKKKKKEYPLDPENLREILPQFKDLEKKFEKLSKDLEDFKKKSQINIQKVGIVRFNPFSEVGGNQSFSIALLDGNNNGVVLTSHYGREFHRVYAKPINHGQSQYQLSKEERQAIDRAINVAS